MQYAVVCGERGEKELSKSWFFLTHFSTGFLEVKGPKEMEMEEKDVSHPKTMPLRGW